MNLSSIPLSELVDPQSQQGESWIVEKFAETQAILNLPMPSLLMNTGSTNQPSEESLQSREEQLQPRNSPGQRDSLDEDVVNQSPKDANQQLQDYPSLSMTPAQESDIFVTIILTY